MTAVKITIEYQTEIGKKVSDLMSGMDLGIEAVLPPPMVITYNTSTKVDKKYKNLLIKKFKKEYKGTDFIIDKITIEAFKEVQL